MSLENMLSIPTLNSLNMYSGVCMCVCVCVRIHYMACIALIGPHMKFCFNRSFNRLVTGFGF